MDGDWRVDLERWLAPYLEGLGHKARQRMCPAYVAGLIGPGDRKSIQPMAARTGEVGYDRLHHFIGAGLWDSGPLEATLWEQADALVGGDKAWLIIDDTALPKKGTASVGVAPQYASALGKNANCQTLVSVTLASREVPIMLGLRLFLPESWTSDEARMVKAGVPEPFRPYRTKPAIAIEEIDRVIAAGVRFGCVLADAGYGLSASFRQGLSTRGLHWAVGIPRHQKVYPADVQLIFPVAGARRRKMATDQLASGNEGTPERALCRHARPHRRRPAATHRRLGRAAHARGRSMAGRRASLQRRAQILSLEPARRYADPGYRRRHQGALDLRAGPSATQGRTRSRPF